MTQETITLEAYLKATKPHKYGAKRTEVDGILFHSKKESQRYLELKVWERCGWIKNLTLQPEFWLTVNGVKIGRWIGDFSYFDLRKGEAVVEDVKGCKTPLYRWKKAHFEAQYERKITESC